MYVIVIKYQYEIDVDSSFGAQQTVKYLFMKGKNVIKQLDLFALPIFHFNYAKDNYSKLIYMMDIII